MRKKLVVMGLVLVLGWLIFGVVGLWIGVKPSLRVEEAIVTPLSVVVVPHHDVVKEERLRFWDEQLRGKDFRRIVIVSPNHFGADKRVIVVGDTDFSTFRGIMRDFYERPAYFGVSVVENTTLVKDDHGVTALLAELYERYPESEVASFLIGDEVGFSELEVLVRYLGEECGNEDCLVVGSVDFSHYLTESAAEERTTEAVRQLEEMGVAEGSLVVPEHADCPACLFVAQEAARERGARGFEAVFRDNYGVERERTTHVMGYWFL
jgi:AmmeMemoRadiSam system protein B